MTNPNTTPESDTLANALVRLEDARAAVERAAGIKADWSASIGDAFAPRELLAGWISAGCKVEVYDNATGLRVTGAEVGNSRIYISTYDRNVVMSLAAEFHDVRAAVLRALPAHVRDMIGFASQAA